MRLPLLLILPIFVINCLTDWYICTAVWRRVHNHAKFWRRTTLWSSIFFALVLVALIVWPKKSSDDATLLGVMWTLYALASVYLAKIVFVIFDLLARIPQIFHRKRIRWLTWAGAGLGTLVFCVMAWGLLVERYRIDVEELTIERADLPAAFDGLRIVQLSDIHIGSYGSDTTYVGRVVETVNSLRPDMIVFTGDIVNRHTSELEPFVGTLARLEAPMGVYSILGNHDYGDYYQWPTPGDKVENMAQMYYLQQQAGWRMLNNTTETFYRGTDSLMLIGVENISDPPFPTYGSLDDAYPYDLDDAAFKILLSHNPTHWVNDIADASDKNIALTLSGHTHAMQFELFGWSPSKYVYPTWKGLYADSDSIHLLYVNTGIGEVGIPARIGATPEITVFTLKKR